MDIEYLRKIEFHPTLFSDDEIPVNPVGWFDWAETQEGFDWWRKTADFTPEKIDHLVNKLESILEMTKAYRDHIKPKPSGIDDIERMFREYEA